MVYHDSLLYVLGTGTVNVLKAGRVVSSTALWPLYCRPRGLMSRRIASLYVQGDGSVCCVIVAGEREAYAFRLGAAGKVGPPVKAAGLQQAEAGGVVYGLSEVYGLGRPAPEEYEYQHLFAGGPRLYLCSGTRLDAWLDGRLLYTVEFAAKIWYHDLGATAVLGDTVYVGGVDASGDGVLFAVEEGVVRKVNIEPTVGPLRGGYAHAVTNVTVTPKMLTYKAYGAIYAYDTETERFLGKSRCDGRAVAAGDGRLFVLREGYVNYVDVY